MPQALWNTIITLHFKKIQSSLLKMHWLYTGDWVKYLQIKLREIIHKILPTKQKCGTPNRQMSEIPIAIDSICNKSEEENMGGPILCIDQESAFDWINHSYFFRILEKLGFEGKSLFFVKEMYEDITSQINIRGN